MVTSDHSPLPVCRDGSQARRTKECVLFSLKATERAGWRKNTTCPFGSRSQIQGRVLLLTTCAAGIGGTFQFGYNLSIINAPTLPIQEFINETWWLRTGQPLPDHLVLFVWSLIVSLYPLGGLFGALLAGPLAVLLGRKKSLLVNNVFVVAAATLFGFSRRAGSFEMIVLGRLLMGVSAGLSMNVQPMYLGESAPKELRGAVAMTPAIFTALGIVIGQVVGLRELLGDPGTWPLLLASCLVPGLLQLAFLPLLPESPRYLLIDRGDTQACLAALQRLRGTADVAGELAELEEERVACQGQRARRPWELFQDRSLRRQVTSLMVLGSAVELCGNDSVYAYASSVFRAAGIPEGKVQYAVLGTGSCELLAACLSCVLIERSGRRVLLIGGYCLMTCWGSIFTVALCLQSSFPWMPYLAMSCIFAFVLSFGIGPAGVTGILAMELFDQKARPAACMVGGALVWTLLFLVGLGFPFIKEGLSHFLYMPFLAFCVCGAIYTGFFLPETKGKTFLEISKELHRLNFPQQSQGPKWTGPEVILSTEL
ncbi:solute carrier family 2, facilitated glucose transporter member 11 isoform X2 [Meles meles]|uniref:solute carrier family 2, facilitated glucose transporter member 11 isoform X2 n=1 Tax=Meles meles TaxID=9662 RepID=UPI001E69F2C5|nr:solute carrier family 2, facilitated glucose transporter member 11 isoform X2 [Meles meles]XP_045881593.1 solute carrier family 2, facilitated glucose transporter member 11 isoform X2 [Meles meles]XP_045881594.1 solute carrier family 2, facilitated glucose transporter member 11 isoform X2 [Meles meles]